jgi:hypothetical protein
VKVGEEEWKGLTQHPFFLAAYPVLDQAYSLFGQACGALDAGADAGASLICRAAVEAAFYLVVTMKRPVDPSSWELDIPRDLSSEPRMVEWRELTRAIAEEKILTSEQMERSRRVHDHGNLIAHLADRTLRKIFSSPTKETLLWIGPKESAEDLRDTADILETMTDWLSIQKLHSGAEQSEKAVLRHRPGPIGRKRLSKYAEKVGFYLLLSTGLFFVTAVTVLFTRFMDSIIAQKNVDSTTLLALSILVLFGALILGMIDLKTGVVSKMFGQHPPPQIQISGSRERSQNPFALPSVRPGEWLGVIQVAVTLV